MQTSPARQAATPFKNPQERTMSDPNFILLYVNSVSDSAAFYARLLGKAPMDASPNFAMFALDSGMMLGLWARHDVQPASAIPAGAGELAFAVADKAAVATRHQQWLAWGLPIIQPLTDMDFGHTFAALDPDGHRLRVFVPSAP
jgi:predicted enzyme related to lactoylglutathione lyase